MIITTLIITVRLTVAIGKLPCRAGEAAFGLESVPAVGYHARAIVAI